MFYNLPVSNTNIFPFYSPPNPYNDNAAVDSSIIKTCKDTTAQRRRRDGKYKDHGRSLGYGTMGYEYGRKVHASIDTYSLSVME